VSSNAGLSLVVVTSAASGNYSIFGEDFSGDGTGTIRDGGTGAYRVILGLDTEAWPTASAMITKVLG